MKKNKKETAEKVRHAPRFHVLDAVIILVVVFAVVCVCFRNNILDYLTGEKNMKEYVVSFSVEDVRKSTLEKYVDVDDVVYFSDDGEELGVLMTHADNSEIPLNIGTASKIFATDDGSLKKVFYPENAERASATGRILCEGRYSSEGGFMINGDRYLSAGQSITIQTEMVTLTVLITGIDPVNE